MNKKQTCLILIEKLKYHEDVSKKRVLKLMRDIQSRGLVINPIVVSKQSYVVLDGHHRVAALKMIGVRTVPAYVVDYFSDDIRVYLRRKEILSSLLKQAVLNKAAQGKIFPMKTTRHIIRNRKRNVRIKLKRLMKSDEIFHSIV